MKKLLPVLLVLVLAFNLSACVGEAKSTNEIPDIFGINYIDAIDILEAEGFDVKAIETNVETISNKLLYPLEKVDKGTVFKIDDYILDNNGNLNKNYDVFYEEGLISNDKSIIIYYAKEDYVLIKNDTPKETTSPITCSDTSIVEPSVEDTETTTTTVKKDEDNTITPDFKAAMDSYEKFFDEYVDIMNKYINNPTDMEILMDYAKYMGQYSDMMHNFENWDNKDMNDAEIAYYIDVQARITKKLLELEV